MSEPQLELDDALEELVSAEQFLDYFDIPYEASVVHVNRLHIMQRYHDYLQQSAALLAEDCSDAARRDVYRQLLARAYTDFVHSDALTEKVFKVFQRGEPQTTFVSVDQLFGDA